MYAHHLWMQQRFYAGLLLIVGLGSVAIAIYQGQILNTGYFAFIFYVPLGLLMAVGFLFYRWRSKVEVREEGVKISNTLQSVTIDYDTIRWVKALPLRQRYENQNGRTRRIVPFMKRHIDEPAVFLKLRATRLSSGRSRSDLASSRAV